MKQKKDYKNFSDVNFTRDYLPHFVKKILAGKKLRVAEIGVREGYYLDRYYPVLKEVTEDFYLVDLWEEEGNDLYHSAKQKEMKTFYEQVRSRYAHDPHVHICKGDSLSWAKKFKNNYFDWIYIDADHTRKAVLADIRAWYPKLKQGGVISGHDAFPHPADHSTWEEYGGFDVEGAVREYFSGGEIVYLTNEKYYQSWFYIKGGTPGQKMHLPFWYTFPMLGRNGIGFVKKLLSTVVHDRKLIYRRLAYIFRKP